MSTRARAAAWALATWGGASAWISLGTATVNDERTLARAVALPPPWLLAALVAGAVMAAAIARRRASQLWPLALTALVWLPYLPGRVPPIFLAWQGPLEGLVWIFAGAGLAGPSLAAALSRWRPLADPAKAPLAAAGIAVVCSTVAFVQVEGLVPGGDEPHYLVITQSLLVDHDLRIENNHQRGDYRPYFPGTLRPDYLQRGQDGEIYPIHPPGISVLVMPGFALAGYRGAVATVILLTALASALAWRLAWRVSASVGAAWFAWAAVFLSVPSFFHSFTIYPDGVGALWVLIGLWALVRLDQGDPPSLRALAGVGAAVSLLPWFHTRFSVIAAAIGLVLVARLLGQGDRWRRLGAFLAVPALMAVAWIGYFWVIWGTPNPAAPYGTYTNTAIAYLGRGVPGMLFDQQFGLFPNAPVYAIAVLGAWLLARSKPRLAVELAVITVPYFLSASSYGMWWGGVSAPARFIVALLPSAVLPLAWWWRERPAIGWRTLSLALLALSVSLLVPKTFVDNGVMIFNFRDGFDALLDWASRSVDLPLAFPSLHRGTPIEAEVEAAIWIGAGLLLVAVAFALNRRRSLGPHAAWTAMTAAAAVVSMGAASLVWHRQGTSGVTVSRSQVAMLAQWNPGFQQTTYRLRPWRRLTAEEFARQIAIGSTDRAAIDLSAPVRLRASRLPAANYDVVVEGTGGLAGELTASIGRTANRTEEWPLGGKRPGFIGEVLRLPVAVHSVTVDADGDARPGVAGVQLRVQSLRTPLRTQGDYARRAARWGAARAFFMDDEVFLEGGGFWTRAGASAEVVIDADEAAAPPTVWVQSGPVATTVTLTSSAWSETLSLGPGQRRPVTLPPAGEQGAWVVRIASGAGFVPAEHDTGSDDQRALGVWIELRP